MLLVTSRPMLVAGVVIRGPRVLNLTVMVTGSAGEDMDTMAADTTAAMMQCDGLAAISYAFELRANMDVCWFCWKRVPPGLRGVKINRHTMPMRQIPIDISGRLVAEGDEVSSSESSEDDPEPPPKKDKKAKVSFYQ